MFKKHSVSPHQWISHNRFVWFNTKTWLQFNNKTPVSKEKEKSSGISIDPEQIASTPTSRRYRVEEERDWSDIKEDTFFDWPHGATYQPDMLDLVASREVFQKILVPAELTAI